MDLVAVAEQIINEQMQLVDYEGESVCFINSSTDIIILKHYSEGVFYGWNVYARQWQDLILLETYNTKREAKNVVKGIKMGLDIGVTYYKLPSN